MLTIDQIKNLKHGDMLYHRVTRNADGTPQRWKVNGKVKTWKRTPGRVEVPIKHGLRSYDYITEDDLSLLCLSEEEALKSDARDATAFAEGLYTG